MRTGEEYVLTDPSQAFIESCLGAIATWPSSTADLRMQDENGVWWWVTRAGIHHASQDWPKKPDPNCIGHCDPALHEPYNESDTLP